MSKISRLQLGWDVALPGETKVSLKTEFKRAQNQTRSRTTGPLISGELGREAKTIRSKKGIPLLKLVVIDLLDIAKKSGITFEAK